MFLFADSFDFYASPSDAGTRWLQAAQDQNIRLVGDTAFGTGQAVSFSCGLGLAWRAVWPSNEGTVYACVRLQYNARNNDRAYLAFVFSDGNSAQATIRFHWDGSIDLVTGSDTGNVVATAPGAFSANAWDSWQMKLVIDKTAGSLELRKNGSTTPILSCANVNTQGGSNNATVNAMTMLGGGSYSYTEFRVDDLFLCTGSGAAPNTWPGDMRAVQQLPAGATQSQFTATGAASNWQALAELHEDADTSYVSSSTAGQEDIYTLSAIPATYAVVGVNYLALWKKTDAGARTAQLSVSANGSADTPAVTNSALSDTYAYSSAFLAADPAGAAWTPATASGAMIGLKVSA